MPDDKQKTPPEEIRILLKRTGLTLNEEQFDALCKSFDGFETASRRLREGLRHRIDVVSEKQTASAQRACS